MLSRRSCLIGLSATALAPLTCPATARAGTVAGFGGSTEFTQLLNNGQLLSVASSSAGAAAGIASQLGVMAQDLIYQFESWQNLIHNTLTLPDRLQAEVRDALRSLYDIVVNSRGLSYRQAGIDRAVRDAYWSETDYRDSNLGREALAERLESVQTQLDGSVEAHFLAMQTGADLADSRAEVLARVSNRLQSASGTNMILRESASIAELTASGILTLISLFTKQGELTSQYAEVRRDREAAERAKAGDYFTRTPTSGTPG